MRAPLFCLLVFLAACETFTVAPDPCPLTVTNGTSDSLWYVYVREAGAADWGQDVLDVDTLADGESVVVDVEGGTSSDVRGTWAGGETFTRYDVAQCDDGEELGLVLSLSDQD